VVFQTDLGEIPNWGSLVSNWRHEWVDWMLEYLVEPTTCSIYRLPEWWSVYLRCRGGGRREGVHWRKQLVAFTVASSPDMHNASYCNMVRHQGTWRKVTRWLPPARMILKRP
jgi:hypothetical protein